MPIESDFDSLSDDGFGSVVSVDDISGLPFDTDISGVAAGEGVFPLHVRNLYKLLSGRMRGAEVGVNGLVVTQNVTVNDTLTAYDVSVKNKFDVDDSGFFGSGVVSEISGTVDGGAGDISSAVTGPDDRRVELTINSGAVDSSEIAFSAVGTKELADKAGRRIRENENAWTTAELQIDRGIEQLDYIRGFYELFNDADKVGSVSAPQRIKQRIEFDGSLESPVDGFEDVLGTTASEGLWWGPEEDPKRHLAVLENGANDVPAVKYWDVDVSQPAVTDTKEQDVPSTGTDGRVWAIDYDAESGVFAFMVEDDSEDKTLYVYDSSLNLLGTAGLLDQQYEVGVNGDEIAVHYVESDEKGVVDIYDTAGSLVDTVTYTNTDFSFADRRDEQRFSGAGAVDMSGGAGGVVALGYMFEEISESGVESAGVAKLSRDGDVLNSQVIKENFGFADAPVVSLEFDEDGERLAVNVFEDENSFQLSTVTILDPDFNELYENSYSVDDTDFERSASQYRPITLEWNRGGLDFLSAKGDGDSVTRIVNTITYSFVQTISSGGVSFDPAGEYVGTDGQINEVTVFEGPITVTSTDIDLDDDGLDVAPGSIVVSDDLDDGPDSSKNIVNYEVSDQSGNTVSVPQQDINQVVFSPSLEDTTLNVSVTLETDGYETELNNYAVNFKPEYQPANQPTNS